MRIFSSSLYFLGLFLTLFHTSLDAADARPPLTNGKVNAIVVNGGTTYLGGKFTKLGEDTGSGVVFDAASGAAVPGWPHINGPVKVAIADGAGGFYIGGDFSIVGNYTRHRVAHLLANKTVDPSFDPNVGLIYNYTFYNSYGSTVNTLSSSVRCLLLDGSTLYIGGIFQQINGSVERWSLAAVNASTGAVLAFDPYVKQDNDFNLTAYPGQVNSLTINGSTLYLGGLITEVNRSSTPGGAGRKVRLALAAVNKVSGVAMNWNPNGDGPFISRILNDYLVPRAMSVSGANLFIGGASPSSSGSNYIGGQSRLGGMAKLDLTTAVLAGWNPAVYPGYNSTVNAFVVVGTTIYVGGTGMSGFAGSLALWSVNSVSGVVGSWNPPLDDGYGSNIVTSMVQGGNRVYVTGSLTDGSHVKRYLASVDLATGQEAAWKPGRTFDESFRPENSGSSQSIDTVCLSGGTLLAGGRFDVFDTAGRDDLAAFDTATGTPSPWSPNVYKPKTNSDDQNLAEVYSLTLRGGSLYVGGEFATANATITTDAYGLHYSAGTPRNRAAAFDSITGQVQPWDPNVDGPVRSLTSLGSTIYAAGDFSGVNAGTVERIGLAAFDANSGNATGWNPAPDDLARVVVTDGTRIFAGGYFSSVNDGAVTRRGLAAFDSVSGAATTWNPNVAVTSTKGVLALALDSATLYAVGEFSGDNSVNGTQRRNFAAAFDLGSGTATPWNPDLDDVADAIVINAGIAYLGGKFNTVNVSTGPYSRRSLAAFYASTGAATICRPLASYDQLTLGGISALAVSGSQLLAGGTYGALPSAPPVDFDYELDSTLSRPGLQVLPFSPADPAIPAPVVTSAITVTAYIGVPFSYQITASNSPTSYSALGLPDGLFLNSATGLISGTPTDSGSANIRIGAANIGGNGTAILNLTITNIPPVPAPVITSAATASAYTGVPLSYQITATNFPTGYSAYGLPNGLSVNANTGLISGTPTYAGIFQVSLYATNAGGTGYAALSLTIIPQVLAPVITSAATASGRVGQAFAYQITADNAPTSYAATGLPAGLNIATGTGLISGTPTAPGTFNVTLGATNTSGTGTAVLTLTVAPNAIVPFPVVTSAVTASVQAGQPFTYQITASNGPTTFAATGLPGGVSINTASGVIAGTPTVPGTYSVGLSATNARGTGTATLVLTVTSAQTVAAPVITSAVSAGGSVGQAFTYQITASNAPTGYAASSLPVGISLDTTSGVISGTPRTAGTYTINLSASNAGGSGTGTLTLTVTADPTVTAPAITSALSVAGQVGQPLAYQITASNVPTRYAAIRLPAGLSVNNASGLITGTPTTAGTFPVGLSATNAGGTGTATLSLTIAAALPTVTLTATTPTVTAGSGGLGVFTLSLSAAQDHDVFVSFTIKGSAVNGGDYVLLKATKKIKAGKTSKPIKITPLGEGAGTGVKRTVALILQPGDGYEVGTIGKVKVKIIGQ